MSWQVSWQISSKMSCQTNSQMSYLKFASPVLDESTIAGVGDVLRSGQLTSGPWVQRFEQDLSAFCGGRPTRVLTSATAAIEVALQLCDIGPGDEVITGAQSFFTVLNMIVKVGARPVFVDCDLVTRNIDLSQVEAAITPATRAIIPTHYPGALVDMDELLALARGHARVAVAQKERRRVRRPRHLQLPSEQECHLDRGWSAGGQRRVGGKAGRSAALSRHRVPEGSDARRRISRGQIQHARRQ